MKTLFRSIALNALSLFFLSQLISGVKIYGGVLTFIVGGFALSLMGVILKPILKLITLPLNIVTFGATSFLINVVILYILTILIPQISINAFIFKGVSILGFIVPKVSFNTFFAFIAAGLLLSGIGFFLDWLTKD